ncbi:MAG: hypothetical protein JJU18_06695 [Oceanicaulis sp.]|nr:hypothetical protein [Oceanicaulis sp.]
MLSNTLIAMLGSNPGPASTIFTTLKNNNIQREAILAVGEDHLPQDDFDLLTIILDRYQSVAKQRNVLAHHVWSIDERIPDGIVMLDPKGFTATSVMIRLARDIPSLKGDDALPIQKKCGIAVASGSKRI